MAILHKSTISPTKPELLEMILGGPADVVGTYRFDDPDGEVGVEGFIVVRDGKARQVVLTYRGASLEDGDDHLVSTMEHSSLGPRWVYDGLGDPVALACFQRALLGEQQQAALEVWDDGQWVETREPSVRLSRVPGEAERAGGALTIATDLDAPLPEGDGPRLRAEWDGGAAIVAALD